MNRLIALVLSGTLLAPMSTLAAPSWFEEVMNSAGAGAVVESTVSVSADTGGNVVTSGSVTTGSASAQVESKTVIAGDAAGSTTVDVDVTSVHNGATSTTSYHKTVSPGQGVSVEIATSTGSSSAHILIETGTSTATATQARIRAAVRSWQGLISNVFSSIASWFSWF